MLELQQNASAKGVVRHRLPVYRTLLRVRAGDVNSKIGLKAQGEVLFELHSPLSEMGVQHPLLGPFLNDTTASTSAKSVAWESTIVAPEAASMK